jgi:hypothetical protein
LVRTQRLIEPEAVRNVLAWEHIGFSLDAAVVVAAEDRALLERALHYSARPLDFRFVERCCRWRPKVRCPYLAEPCPFGASIVKDRLWPIAEA